MGPCFPELFFIDGINLKKVHHVGIDQTHGELRIHGEVDTCKKCVGFLSLVDLSGRFLNSILFSIRREVLNN